MTNLITAAILKESRLMALHSILDSVIVNVQKRLTCNFEILYLEIFLHIRYLSIKKSTQNEAGRKIKQENNGQRREVVVLNPKNLEEEIGDVVVRTRKHLGELIYFKVLNSLDRITGEYAESHVPMTITDVAQII
ncbi:hypothetical protein CWI36_0570p0020 [Hamiltosporidium magnivora]|uniref:Uncharacterized protein n=1 Tax=Hamiltosporidium magnivora TaxID=148818 RepID=A0A4Q9LD10_9MICR|nr:hypothetical protein CWI36_0570p0020 [Hamiltosporidium magnivora]